MFILLDEAALELSWEISERSFSRVDIPRSKKEARALQQIGVIPTHVLQIVPPNGENEKSDFDRIHFNPIFIFEARLLGGHRFCHCFPEEILTGLNIKLWLLIMN